MTAARQDPAHDRRLSLDMKRSVCKGFAFPEDTARNLQALKCCKSTLVQCSHQKSADFKRWLFKALIDRQLLVLNRQLAFLLHSLPGFSTRSLEELDSS